jgi:hypothetical protein
MVMIPSVNGMATALSSATIMMIWSFGFIRLMMIEELQDKLGNGNIFFINQQISI